MFFLSHPLSFHRQARRWHSQLAGVVLLTIVAAMVFLAAPPARALRAQPVLLELASEQPQQTVRVIVRKQSADAALEDRVVQLAGRITNRFGFINSFAAELPAAAVRELAAEPGIAWISLDAPTTASQSSGAVVFTSWATQLGSVVPSGFTNSNNVLSVVGPNKTYAYGSSARGSFGGFDFEINPDYIVNRAEILLRAYVPTTLSSASNATITVLINGQPKVSKTVPYTAFNKHIGKSAVGTIAIEVLSGANLSASQFAQWEQLIKSIEVVVDQSSFGSNQVVYYDAVGVRVTQTPGAATLAPVTVPTASAYDINTGALLNAYNYAIRTPEVWNRSAKKLQGQGITIALVDSGVNRSDDLDDRVLANVSFDDDLHDSNDRYGHGTHIAGIIAGDGKHSKGQRVGIAPKANLLNLRVSDDEGMAAESDVVAALQWIYDNKDRYKIRVVNVSINSSVAQSYHTSPLAAATEILWFNGVVVVVSAGNNGSATLYPPANDPFVITVGATDDKGTATITDDTVSSFSAYGSTEGGLGKPELVAPGTNIITLVPDNSQLTIGKRHSSHRVNSNYFRMSGTSMAAPMVTGAVALLLQNEPDLTPDQVKYRLMATAVRDTGAWPAYDPTKAGAGYLDIKAAIDSTTTENANTGVEASAMLWTGSEPLMWNSASWNSASWNSASWNSASWNSASWNSASWNSDHWD